MAISAQDATLLFKESRYGSGVAMQEVQQYSLNLETRNIRRFQDSPVWKGGQVGRLRIVAFKNNAIGPNVYGRKRFLNITHGSGQDLVTTFDGWVRVANVSVDAVRSDVLRYTIDMDVIWITF